MRVLIIDDDELGNFLVGSILSSHDFIEHFHIETNGYIALEYLEKAERSATFPHIIFVDLKMPEIDGFEFIELYEESFYPKFRGTKVMVLTSSIREKEKRQALEFPSVVDFISKPLSDELLHETYKSLRADL